MIKSMTGFASTNTEIDVAAIGVTVRSVNHRYLDLQLRTPSILGEVESKLRTIVQTKVARGRIELALTIRMTAAPAVDVSWNAPLVEALRGAVRQAEERDLSAGGLATGDLLRFPQAVVVQEREPEADTVRAVQTAVLAEVERALGELDTMRRREGDYLRADLDQRRGTVGSLVNAMAEAAKGGWSRVAITSARSTRPKAAVRRTSSVGRGETSEKSRSRASPTGIMPPRAPICRLP